MKSLVSGVLVRLGSLSREGKFLRACSRVSWFTFIDRGEEGGNGGWGGLFDKLPYILSDLKRSRKSNQMLSNTLLMSTENVKFYQPGPTFPGSIRKSIYRGYVPKNLVPSVRAQKEPGPKCPGSIRKSFDRVYLPKNLVPSVRAHGEPGPKCPGSIRKSFDRVYLPKNLVPSVRAHGEPGPKCPGSIRKSFDQGYLPKNLVPSVLAHGEPGPKCPGSVRKFFDQR